MITVTGERNIIKNLNRAIGMIDGRTVEGVRAAALFIEGESGEITPQKTGVLLNSSFSRAGMVNGEPTGVVGYTAEYAGIVHEMPESNNFTKQGTSSGFLMKAVKNNVISIIQIIKNRVKF